MPYDTSNRWLNGVLAEAGTTVPNLPWSRKAKRLRRVAKDRPKVD